MTTHPITSKICPTYRVECGKNKYGNAFLIEDNRLITVRHVVNKALSEEKPADILVHHSQGVINCEIVKPYINMSLSEITVIMLKPKENEANQLLLNGFPIRLYDDKEKSEPYTIGYLGNNKKTKKRTREFVSYEDIDDHTVDKKSERKNYAFAPKAESPKTFKGLSGSPVFIEDGFFGLINYEEALNDQVDKVLGFCGKEFFEELFTLYRIKCYTEGGRTYGFVSDNSLTSPSLAQQESKSEENPMYSIPDQFAKDCFDSYNDYYSNFWTANRDVYPCLREFDRQISYAWSIPVKSSSVQKVLEAEREKVVQKAISQLLDKDFISEEVDGYRREECVSWILGAKYWQVFESISFEGKGNEADWKDQANRLHALLSIKPEHIPDIPQRHLIEGLLWFPILSNRNRITVAEYSAGSEDEANSDLSMEIEFAKDAFLKAIALCDEKWEKTNCHADALCLLGNVKQWENPEASLIEFNGARDCIKDKQRSAELFRRMAMRFKHLGCYSDAIMCIKKAIEEDYREPIDLVGVKASYSRLLDICCIGSKLSRSEDVKRECQLCAIEALSKYRKMIEIPEYGKNILDFASNELSQGKANVIPITMLFETFFDVYKRFHKIERWTDSALLEQISTMFWQNQLGDHLCYTHNVRNDQPVLIAWLKNMDINKTMKKLLDICVTQSISMLFTIAPIATAEYEIFKEFWQTQRKMMSSVEGFTIVEELLENQPWLEDKKVRVYPCVFEASNDKLLYVLHMVCHTR